jgi:hypothetical protein
MQRREGRALNYIYAYTVLKVRSVSLLCVVCYGVVLFEGYRANVFSLRTAVILIRDSKKQSSSWEANLFSGSQEIPRILWNTKVNYQIHRRPPPVPILSQIVPVHASPSHSFNLHLNSIIPSVPRSYKWFLSVWFPSPKPCMSLSCPPYMPHALPISSIWSPEQYLVRNTDHKAPRYVIFSTLMLPRCF